MNLSLQRRGSRECRVLAAPAVSCAICTQQNAHEHTGTAGAARHSLRNGLTAYAELSPETNSFCLRRRRIEDRTKPGRASQNLRRLDTSHGCQDHTVLPYASAPYVLRATNRSRDTRPAIPISRPTPSRPPQPVPTFVTMANAPLGGTGWREL